MSVAEVVRQIEIMSDEELRELVDEVNSIIAVRNQSAPADTDNSWGRNLVAMILSMPPIELVDPHIEDPVEWVKAQRQKDADRLKPYWDGDL